MKLFNRPPAEVSSLLERGERALAWAETSDGGWLVATGTRLCGSGPTLDYRWVSVLGASWDPPVLELKIWTPQRVDTSALTIPQAGVLPQVIRERIMQSLVVQRHVALSGKKGVRFLARRDPETDLVTWQTVLDAGVDASDPAVAARIAESLAVLREAYGV